MFYYANRVQEKKTEKLPLYHGVIFLAGVRNVSTLIPKIQKLFPSDSLDCNF